VSQATLHIGDVFDVLATFPDQSVQSVITSPPYWRKRAYLDTDHPEKAKEIGQEPSPGAFLATLLRLTDELWRIVRDDGTIWVNLGDTAAGSGGWGGDVDKSNRGGGRRWVGVNGSAVDSDAMPRPKSVCWIPELFGASLAYGRNLLTGEPCRQWITRPQITWCKPSVTPGEIIDKFREATELIVWASKEPTYYFDLDAVRLPPVPENERTTWNQNGPKALAARAVSKDVSGHERYTKRTTNEKGAPPLNWWKINTSGYKGAHFATFPPELIVRPVKASCPAGGVILDPFGGSGTTAAVATGHGRDCILIDLDESNEPLIANRLGFALADVIDHRSCAVGDREGS
jgi:DNA modification methylase